MKILIACEYSGRVRDAFIKQGHDAISCDIRSSDIPGPHYQGDVRDILNNGWDMLIAFPPCTFLSKAGARWMWKGGKLSENRFKKAMKAKEFFLELLNCDIKRICIENPFPLRICNLPPHQQEIQPFYFGDPFRKKTLLWLKNLPNLKATNPVHPIGSWISSNTGGKARGQKSQKGFSKNWKERAQTFKGIADAMSDQWSNLNGSYLRYEQIKLLI